MGEARKVMIDPLVDNNPVTLQVLGICSALAVTTSLLPSLLMCLALTSVCALSTAAISSIRNRIPNNIRIITISFHWSSDPFRTTIKLSNSNTTFMFS